MRRRPYSSVDGAYARLWLGLSRLLYLAPTWFMSINQLGFYYGSVGDSDGALPLYTQVPVLMKPDHFIGYFNLALRARVAGGLRGGHRPVGPRR
ncbi:hypothetical protein GCM10009541_53980 [Micromonospora gifhornensis]|uniref:Uncharacterized protein n=1 Tax=Micromonospora gifhornensis TaxID=84594 RepID=A0ABQ4IL11_9ACTN|nr:hypothetical protein Vgi01_50770 [Micromonospora gifhornensis]